MNQDLKIELSSKNVFCYLIVIILISLIIRLIFFPHNIPVISDALNFFWYANDISILGKLPSYSISNDGWPIFLSIFFTITKINFFMDDVIIQRSLSVALSLITIIPIFFLSRNFFGIKYGLVGASIFAFEPRLIQNSLLGVSDPLFLLLVTISLTLFFNPKKKLIYPAFFVIGLSTIVRTEGIFLFLSLSIIYFIYLKKEKLHIQNYIILLGIFLIVVLLMMHVRTEVSGKDFAVETLQVGSQKMFLPNEDDPTKANIGNGFITLIKFLVWDLIPVFIIFVPVGLIIMLKMKNKRSLAFIIIIIFMLIPTFYAYSTNALDTRYIFPVFPIFILISLFAIKFYENKFGDFKFFLVLIIMGVLISSIIFIVIKNQDDYQKEVLVLTPIIIQKTEKINQFLPESSFIPPTVLSQLNEFPVLRENFDSNEKHFHCHDIEKCPQVLVIEGNTIEEYISNGMEKGLTHLIIDNSNHILYREVFFNDVFENEVKYPYLIKIFDSREEKLSTNYHLKIFEIDYEGFNLLYSK